MADGREHVKEELTKLIERGEHIADCEAEVFEKDLPYDSFIEDYQRWYTAALPVIDQVLPDRATEFRELYEGKRGEGDITIHIRTRHIQDDDLFRGHRHVAFDRSMRQQVYLLQGAADRLDSHLADIRGVVEAEVFDSELDRALELAKKRHLRPAGVVAGVVLESHLKEVCRSHGLTVRKPTIGALNDTLRDAGVYDMPSWRRVQHLGDIRNICGHDDSREPTRQEVDDLVAGVQWAVKTLF
jgi:hypothetical protein